MKTSNFGTLVASMACSALLFFPAAAFAQTAPAKPMGSMHQGMAGHDKMGPGMHGDMKAGMKSSCMSKAGMQKMGMSQKRMAHMSSMCRAEKKAGMGPAGANNKPAAMKTMPKEHEM